MSNTAQNWLDTKYKDKNGSGKIELYDWTTGNSEELTGELEIKNYVNIEEIRLTRRDKKGKIKKVVIENCPQVEKIKLDNNEITEIVFKGNFPKLERLDLSNNGLKEIDVSLTPNLNGLNLNSNPDLVEIRGLENLTKLKTLILLDTSGLNNKEFREWKERPTKEELAKAVNDKADEFKEYIKPSDLETKAREKGMVSKEEYEKVEKERDSRPNTTLDEYKNLQGNQEKHKPEDLEKHTAADLKPADYDNIKNKLDEWEKVFGKDKNPADVKKELDSKPATGGSSGIGSTLTAMDQKKMDDYYTMTAYFISNQGKSYWRKFIDDWKAKNNYEIEKAKKYLSQIEQSPK